MDGIPAVVLHGGPGGSIHKKSLQQYDLQTWCVLLFDQRGCGKSKPFGSVEHNTTWDLVSDIEQLRKLFRFESWFVAGSSWGTTLALVYAETYPERVTGLLLQAVCLQDYASQQWKRGYGGASSIFPNEWEQYVSLLPKRFKQADWKAIAKFYQKKLVKNDAEAQRYAETWWGWESAIASLLPRQNMKTPTQALSLAKLENHYFVHDCFIEEGQIMKNIDTLQSIPITIVHGRYDMVCPARGAIALANALPQAKLILLPDSGHSSSKKTTLKRIRKTLRSFTRKISKIR